MVAMAHAARFPGAVSKLVLIVTAAHGGFMAHAEQFVRDHGTVAQQRACERLWSGTFETPEQMADYYAAMGPLYSRRYDPAAAEAVRGRAIYAPGPLNQAFGPGGVLRSFDLRPEIGRVAVPTLVLAGRHDWICPPEFSEEIHRLIPGSRLRIFEDSSHTIRADEPDALNAAIREFVAG
jgi:proline iminopeptidase